MPIWLITAFLVFTMMSAMESVPIKALELIGVEGSVGGSLKLLGKGWFRFLLPKDVTQVSIWDSRTLLPGLWHWPGPLLSLDLFFYLGNGDLDWLIPTFPECQVMKQAWHSLPQRMVIFETVHTDESTSCRLPLSPELSPAQHVALLFVPFHRWGKGGPEESVPLLTIYWRGIFFF